MASIYMTRNPIVAPCKRTTTFKDIILSGQKRDDERKSAAMNKKVTAHKEREALRGLGHEIFGEGDRVFLFNKPPQNGLFKNLREATAAKSMIALLDHITSGFEVQSQNISIATQELNTHGPYSLMTEGLMVKN